MPPKKIPRPEKGQTLLTFNSQQNPNISAENDANHNDGNDIELPEAEVTVVTVSEVEHDAGDRRSKDEHDESADGVSSGTGKSVVSITNTQEKRKRKFNANWLKIWPWLYFIDEKMYCKDCVKGGKSNSFTEGCITFRTSSMSRHESTSDHAACLNVVSLNLRSDMQKAMKKVNAGEDQLVCKLLKTVQWLVNENLPLSKFESLTSFLKDVNVPGLDVVGGDNYRIKYQSYYTANELLDSLNFVADCEVNKKCRESPYMSILADESTDIANTRRMTITARVINPETSVCSTIFLQDLEYEDGTGVGLTQQITNQLSKRSLSIAKVIGLGTDGASVMTGLGKGVYGRLKELNPHIINVHCMAHRLALCTSQAANSIPTLKKYQEFLTNLFYYFKQSAAREKELHKIQELLDHPTLCYREIHAVRWMSFFEALQAVYRTIDPLITYFHNRIAAKDPKAKGLLKYMASRTFLFITYLMMDVIPIVSKLCLAFQKEDLNIAKAKISIDLCLSDLESLKSGDSFRTHQHLAEEFDTMEKVGDHYEYHGHKLTEDNTNYTALKSVFLNKLIQNIRDRFPEKSLIDSFFVLAMRTINFEKDIMSYGTEEIDCLLKHYGEKQIHNNHTSDPLLDKDLVRNQWKEAKIIVQSAKYPVDDMPALWKLLSMHHNDALSEIIKLAQIALLLPLHTAGCERVFSQQNLIITKQRNRLSPNISDKLLRVKLEGSKIDFELALKHFKEAKQRRIKIKD